MTAPSSEAQCEARYAEAIDLLADVRKICAALALLLFVLGAGLAFVFDYMTETRAKIERTEVATRSVEAAFNDFRNQDSVYVSNHERTQRLICGWYRATGTPLPDNGDCENR